MTWEIEISIEKFAEEYEKPLEYCDLLQSGFLREMFGGIANFAWIMKFNSWLESRRGMSMIRNLVLWKNPWKVNYIDLLDRKLTSLDDRKLAIKYILRFLDGDESIIKLVKNVLASKRSQDSYEILGPIR